MDLVVGADGIFSNTRSFFEKKKNELNLVCVIRDTKYDPNNVNHLINKTILTQNPSLKELFWNQNLNWKLMKKK